MAENNPSGTGVEILNVFSEKFGHTGFSLQLSLSELSTRIQGAAGLNAGGTTLRLGI